MPSSPKPAHLTGSTVLESVLKNLGSSRACIVQRCLNHRSTPKIELTTIASGTPTANAEKIANAFEVFESALAALVDYTYYRLAHVLNLSSGTLQKEAHSEMEIILSRIVNVIKNPTLSASISLPGSGSTTREKDALSLLGSAIKGMDEAFGNSAEAATQKALLKTLLLQVLKEQLEISYPTDRATGGWLLAHRGIANAISEKIAADKSFSRSKGATTSLKDALVATKVEIDSAAPPPFSGCRIDISSEEITSLRNRLGLNGLLETVSAQGSTAAKMEK